MISTGDQGIEIAFKTGHGTAYNGREYNVTWHDVMVSQHGMPSYVYEMGFRTIVYVNIDKYWPISYHQCDIILQCVIDIIMQSIAFNVLHYKPFWNHHWWGRGIEIWYKWFKAVKWQILVNNYANFRSIIFEAKWDRDKPIFFCRKKGSMGSSWPNGIGKNYVYISLVIHPMTQFHC